MLVPSVVHQMVNHSGIEKADFSSVLNANSGAAYLPPELGEKISSLMPKESYFSEGYGMSEAVRHLYLPLLHFPPNTHSFHRQ